MNVIAVIPARMASTRFPNKPLAKLLGMPMIGHCYHRTILAEGITDTYVATCDQEIIDYINSIGGSGVMTSDQHTRASTRTAEAVDLVEKETGKHFDLVIMVQGDEPMIYPETISETLKHFSDPDVRIVNIMTPINSLEAFRDPNNVKVVVNQDGHAIYFSREPIPSPWKGWENIPKYLQTGIIAFRREALTAFNALPETLLEQIESIDMNRVIEKNWKIRMVRADYESIGVDTEEDLASAEVKLKSDPYLKQYLAV